MVTNRPIGFGELFEAMWRVFTRCYGLLLGFSVLLVSLNFILFCLVFGLLGWICAAFTKESALGPIVILTCVHLALVAVVAIPIAAYIQYEIL